MKNTSKKFILSLCLGLAVVAGVSCNFTAVTEASPMHPEYQDAQVPPPPAHHHHHHKKPAPPMP